MSAPIEVNAALAQLDQIQTQIENITVSDAKATPAKGGLPTETKDLAWWPIVPVGHTAFTFYGVDSDRPTGVIANPKSSKPAAAPAQAPAAASSSSSAAPAGKPQEKKEKAPAAAAAAKPAAAAKAPKNAPKAAEVEPDQPDFTKLDIRVGQIVKAARHPKPEVTSLYVEMIDVGEAEPRQIVSGLVKYIPLEQFQTARCLVICNLKPSPLQGEMSNGMVLAASTGEGDARVVELIQPPAGSKPGDRIIMLDGSPVPSPMEMVDPRKKDKKTGLPDNAWSRTAVTLKTNGEKQATWNGVLIGTKEHGPATAATLAGANIA